MKTPTPSRTAENFRALHERIKNANDAASLDRIEQAATRVYNAGQLSPRELQRLDVFAMERRAKMECAAAV